MTTILNRADNAHINKGAPQARAAAIADTGRRSPGLHVAAAGDGRTPLAEAESLAMSYINEAVSGEPHLAKDKMRNLLRRIYNA